MRFVRFRKGNTTGFGVLEGEQAIRVYAGEMFGSHRPAAGR